ncbi:hypothetical protein BACSP_03588 [Bacillus sp. T2.9-1]|jgi:putative transposase|nr:hypothetical protein BACSP_03588 [Bacillus sp. T2.9-1]
MSRRKLLGQCPQESFFGHLKDEVDYQSCQTIKELKGKINHYITWFTITIIDINGI